MLRRTLSGAKRGVVVGVELLAVAMLGEEDSAGAGGDAVHSIELADNDGDDAAAATSHGTADGVAGEMAAAAAEGSVGEGELAGGAGELADISEEAAPANDDDDDEVATITDGRSGVIESSCEENTVSGADIATR